MFAFLAAFVALAEPVVLDRIAQPADATMTAEMIERPAGLSPSAFLAQLIAEAGAGEWQRHDAVGPYGGRDVRIVGLRGAAGDGLMFFLPAGEQEPGNFCRIRRLREGPPAQGDSLVRYCLAAVGAGR